MAATGRNGAATPTATTRPMGTNIPDRVEYGAIRSQDRTNGNRTRRKTSSGSLSWVANRTATRSSPVAKCTSARTTAPDTSNAIRQASIWVACSASASRTGSSSGNTPAKNCPPAASTTGRCRASAVRPWSKANGCGSSPVAAKSPAWTRKGFYDDENDGPYNEETVVAKDEADVVWKFDMMRELGVSQHNMASCSITSWGDLLLVNTSNGLDESHINLPAPNAPSFICMNKHTGEVYWTKPSAGRKHPARSVVVARPPACWAACRK